MVAWGGAPALPWATPLLSSADLHTGVFMKLRNVRGGRLEELKALKKVLAAGIDGCEDVRTLPQLAKQYRETIREIEEIEGAADDGDEVSEIIKKRDADGQPGAVRKSRTGVSSL